MNDSTSPEPGRAPSAPELAADARECLARARQEAERLGHPHVATEHLVLSLLAVNPPGLEETLTTAGTTPDALRAEMERKAGRARRRRGSPAEEGASEEVVLTSQARRVLAAAAERGGGEVSLDSLFGVVRDAGNILVPPRPKPEPRPKAPPKPEEPAPAPDTAASAPPTPERRERAPRQPAEERKPVREREERKPRGEGEERRPRGEGERKARPETEDQLARRLREDARSRREHSPGRVVPGDTRADRGAGRTPKRDRPEPPPKPVVVASVRRDPRAVGDIVRPILLLAVPATIAMSLLGASSVAIFVAACVAIVPLAAYMGESTGHLAARSGPAAGGLLHAIFGHGALLVIAIAALQAGLVDLVKAAILGSVLANLLLVLGLVLLVGGTRAVQARPNRSVPGGASAILLLAVVGLVLPSLFLAVHPAATPTSTALFSTAAAVLLAVTFLVSLLPSRRLFGEEAEDGQGGLGSWSAGRSAAVLSAATAGVAVMGWVLVREVATVSRTQGLSPVFIGLVIIPVIASAASRWQEVAAAVRGRTEGPFRAATGSGASLALLVAPVLVLTGVLMAQPMDLVFSTFQVLTTGLATLAAVVVTRDGESHWVVGVQLLAVYALVVIAASFV